MQIRHPIKSKSIVKRLSNMFMESRFTILYLYQKAVKNAKAKRKETLPNETSLNQNVRHEKRL